MKKYSLVLLIFFLPMAAWSQRNAALLISNGNFLMAGNAQPSIEKVKAQVIMQASAVKILKDDVIEADKNITVDSFRMTLIRKSGNLELKSENEEVTTEMKTALKTLMPGDKVYFEYIKGTDDNGTTRSFAALSFVIEN
jgi:hypothetical protein